jgi:thioredoxin reductase
MREPQTLDTVVIGGGPAGLSAALWLGRYRRRTAVIDAGRQRNLSSTALHGYSTRDGVSPQEFLGALRAEVDGYPTVDLIDGVVRDLARSGDRFNVTTEEGVFDAARVVLTTGVEDAMPNIPGFDRHYGSAIFHCSCCDGYESRDQDVLAIGWGEHVAGFALDLLDWGARVTLVTNGESFEGDAACRSSLGDHSIEILEEKVEEILTQDERMHGVRLGSGREVPATRAFFSIAHEPRNSLARSLGVRVDELGYVKVGAHGETNVEHVYAAGDITPGEQLVQTASAEGAVAGIACAMSLRGTSSAPGAPEPGPDPERVL